jgi:hypothetical protein
MPDASSPVEATLTPGTVVYDIGRQMDANGAVWLQITMPDGSPLGWLKLTDLQAAGGTGGDVSVDPTVGMPVGFPGGF